MRKIVDLCFYFLFKKKIRKKCLFLVPDKETPLKQQTLQTSVYIDSSNRKLTIGFAIVVQFNYS